MPPQVSACYLCAALPDLAVTQYKFILMKTHPLALLSALVPFAALIGGCGGGNSGPAKPTPTPFLPATELPPVSPPIPSTVVVPQTVLRLPNGELGLLNLSRTGGSLSGQLRVFNVIAAGNTLNAGVYPLSGSLSAPTAFSVSNNGQGTGTSSNVPKFTITGNLPAPDAFANGAYTFTQDKFVATGALLSSRAIFLPASSPYRPIGDLQFARLGSNTNSPLPAAVTPEGPNAFDLRTDPGDGDQRATLDYDLRDSPILANLSVKAKRRGGLNIVSNLDVSVIIQPTTPFVVGQSFLLQRSDQADGVFASAGLRSNGLSYGSISGTVTIRSITGNSVVLELRNVILNPDANNPGLGNLTMNGTIEASGLGAFVIGK